VVNIDGKEYAEDDLNDEQKYLVNQLQSIEQKLGLLRFDFDQLMAAKTVFGDKLAESLNAETSAEE
jgi:hypothetical protein